MDDERAMTLFEIKKFVAYPMQVMWRLLRQRNAGAQPCVNEKKIAAGKTVLKTIQKDAMRFGKEIEQATMDAELGCAQIGVRQAIGLKCLPAADI